jgi:hypothetical protein
MRWRRIFYHSGARGPLPLGRGVNGPLHRADIEHLFYTLYVSSRALEVVWTPRTQREWATFSASRREAARVWGDRVVRHHRIRRLGWRWPSRSRWQRWAKGRYPGLSAQSTQQIIGEFCEAVDSCRQLHEQGPSGARYPWRRPH